MKSTREKLKVIWVTERTYKKLPKQIVYEVRERPYGAYLISIVPSDENLAILALLGVTFDKTRTVERPHSR